MKTVPDYFGSLVFDDRVMKSKLSSKVYNSLKKTIDEGAQLDSNVANAVADAWGDGFGIDTNGNLIVPTV